MSSQNTNTNNQPGLIAGHAKYAKGSVEVMLINLLTVLLDRNIAKHFFVFFWVG